MKKLTAMFARFKNEKRGNVMMMTGFAIIPLVGATGIGVDYARAARIDTKLSAAADAAALAAVSQPMMLKTETEAHDYAVQIFNQQAAAIPGLIYDPNDATNLTIVVNHSGSILNNRTVSVTFAAKTKNMFGAIVGVTNLNVGGVATSRATRAPNIDFYLLMDSSPSMALPTTSAGLDKIRTMTGCAFACHLTQPHSENIYIRDNSTFNILKTMNNYNSGTQRTTINANGDYIDSSGDVHNADDTYVDSVWLAKNTVNPGTGVAEPIVLRIDEERRAVQELMTLAAQQAIDNATTYRAALFTFNYGPNFTKMFPTTASPAVTSNLSGLAAQAPNIQLMNMYVNGCPSNGFCNDDQETDFYTALGRMQNSTTVPNPGNGTNGAGDTPKGIIFIVTDGMSDENLGGRTHREIQAAHIAQCTSIKNRGLKIAILYTKYLPESLTGNSWSQSNVAPYLANVAPALEACASPGLMYTVTTNQSISASLQDLFKEATSQAHLTS